MIQLQVFSILMQTQTPFHKRKEKKYSRIYNAKSRESIDISPTIVKGSIRIMNQTRGETHSKKYKKEEYDY